MQQYRQEDEDAEGLAHTESAGDRDAVDERVEHQSRQRRKADDLRDVVDFFTEMKMRRESVLGEMHQQITNQDHKRRGLTVGYDRIGREIEQRNGNHESGGERDHVLEGANTPARARDDCRGTYDVGASGNGRIEEGGGVQEPIVKINPAWALRRFRWQNNDK